MQRTAILVGLGTAAASLLIGCPRTAPKAPTNLTVSPTGPHALTLTWQRGGGDEKGFRVDRKQWDGFREVATLPAGTTRFEAAELDPQESYSFRVVALGAGSEKKLAVEGSGTTTAFTLKEAVAATKPSVLLVARIGLAGPLGTGSGFVIRGPRGGAPLVVTNHHVVEGEGELRVQVDRTLYPATAVLWDRTNDVAILTLHRRAAGASVPAGISLPPPLRLGISEDASEGTALVAIGYPLPDVFDQGKFDLTSSIAPGVLTALRQRTQYETSLLGVPHAVSCKVIQMSCPVSPGNSGGPVLDVATGKVIGITVSGLYSNGVPVEGIKFAIPVDYLTRLVYKNYDLERFRRGVFLGGRGSG